MFIKIERKQQQLNGLTTLQIFELTQSYLRETSCRFTFNKISNCQKSLKNTQFKKQSPTFFIYRQFFNFLYRNYLFYNLQIINLFNLFMVITFIVPIFPYLNPIQVIHKRQQFQKYIFIFYIHVIFFQSKSTKKYYSLNLIIKFLQQQATFIIPIYNCFRQYIQTQHTYNRKHQNEINMFFFNKKYYLQGFFYLTKNIIYEQVFQFQKNNSFF
eukprot:TRINITY_DN3367_c0_g1_i2.p1 TRINITY_DN3367_c0_g1~~TRINITY_DN3367_c0_g1_i2.p1  ORF type:complete len:213 (-),score=-18.44 TRINITY_DN3367_c0_g1_i2:214-852(-)